MTNTRPDEPPSPRCRAFPASEARAGPATLPSRRPLSGRGRSELNTGGLTWIHVDAPDADEVEELAARFGWHALDVEDVLSKRQRPKVDDYGEEGYLFAVLHFPVYDKLDRPAERGRARPLPRA